MRRALVLALLAAVPHAVAAQQPQTPAPMPPSAAPPSAAAAPAYPVKGSGTVVLRAARLIDGTGAAPVQNAVVVVTDDRIVAVGREGVVAVPAGARVVDLGDATLLPGFIDMHTHIIGRTLADPASDVASVRDYASYGAILATDNARRTLMAGFTTIRNLGAPNFDDMALRQAIDAGVVAGPRMQTAGHSFGITGGHCDDNGWRPGLADNDYRSGVADGADEVRKAVRYQAKYGADVLKICATGGVLSEGDAVGRARAVVGVHQPGATAVLVAVAAGDAERVRGDLHARPRHASAVHRGAQREVVEVRRPEHADRREARLQRLRGVHGGEDRREAVEVAHRRVVAGRVA